MTHRIRPVLAAFACAALLFAPAAADAQKQRPNGPGKQRVNPRCRAVLKKTTIFSNQVQAATAAVAKAKATVSARKAKLKAAKGKAAKAKAAKRLKRAKKNLKAKKKQLKEAQARLDAANQEAGRRGCGG